MHRGGSLAVSQTPQAGQKGLNTKLRALAFDSVALGSHRGFVSEQESDGKKKGGGCFWRIRVAAACRVSWIEGKDRGQEARSAQRGGGLSPGAVETEEEEEMGLRDGRGRWEGRGSPQPQMSQLSSSDGDGTLRCGKLAPVPRLSQPQLSVGRGETSAGGEEETRLCMEVRGNQPGPEGSGRRGLGARRCWGAMEGS